MSMGCPMCVCLPQEDLAPFWFTSFSPFLKAFYCDFSVTVTSKSHHVWGVIKNEWQLLQILSNFEGRFLLT